MNAVMCNSFMSYALVMSLLSACSSMASALPAQRLSFFVENLDHGASGKFVVEVHPEWAPLAAARFVELAKASFFDANRFFKVVTGFVAEFGISGDPQVTSAWESKTFADEPRTMSNTKGRLSFVQQSPNSRSTQIAIHIQDNYLFDKRGYVPFAEVVEGMWVIERLYQRYRGDVPQRELAVHGNAFVEKQFPNLSVIKSVQVEALPTQTLPETGDSTSRFVSGGMIAVCSVVLTGVLWSAWSLSRVRRVREPLVKDTYPVV